LKLKATVECKSLNMKVMKVKQALGLLGSDSETWKLKTEDKRTTHNSRFNKKLR